ncbi:MAG: hypothetical protein CMC79_04610 [Flavobacteriaceae bacterium]|nr:hypothetical protein [Flavobacteriaceae bacterium]|tara:strand:+ start:17111 stop:17626 length:516 start_codon:yes stop_codon:yes gene_type:complete
MDFNWIDVICLITISYGCIIGYKKGLIKELAGFFSVFLGILGVIKFSNSLSLIIEGFLDWHHLVIYLLSCIIIFSLIIYTISIIAKILTKTLQLAALGFINRIVGLFFGGLKWIIILTTFIFIISEINQRISIINNELTESSVIFNTLYSLGETVYEMVYNNKSSISWEYL